MKQSNNKAKIYYATDTGLRFSKKDRDKLIEKMLSDWRSAYLKLVIRKEKQKQTVESEKPE